MTGLSPRSATFPRNLSRESLSIFSYEWLANFFPEGTLMSAAIAKQPTLLPVFNQLVADVTPKIIQSLRSPAMRSLSQTRKAWNHYLKEVWDLNQRNYRYSARIIKEHRVPALCFLDIAERLADVSPAQSLELIDTVLPIFSRLEGSSRNSLMTLLSFRTGMALSGSFAGVAGGCQRMGLWYRV